VVYKKPSSDLGTRMNFYPREEAIEVRQKAREKPESVDPENMGEAMEPHSMQPRIAKDDFPYALGRWIPLEDHPDIFSDPLKHLYSSG
jgi:hypothetical protein